MTLDSLKTEYYDLLIEQSSLSSELHIKRLIFMDSALEIDKKFKDFSYSDISILVQGIYDEHEEILELEQKIENISKEISEISMKILGICD